jgi:hypothetical protein
LFLVFLWLLLCRAAFIGVYLRFHVFVFGCGSSAILCGLGGSMFFFACG